MNPSKSKSSLDDNLIGFPFALWTNRLEYWEAKIKTILIRVWAGFEIWRYLRFFEDFRRFSRFWPKSSISWINLVESGQSGFIKWSFELLWFVPLFRNIFTPRYFYRLWKQYRLKHIVALPVPYHIIFILFNKRYHIGFLLCYLRCSCATFQFYLTRLLDL